MNKIFASLLLVLACSTAEAQNSSCPTIGVDGPMDTKAGEPATFVVKTKGGDPNVKAGYNWTVSAGTITSGQRTSRITISTEGLAANDAVTATVEVSGYSSSCSTTASNTSFLIENPEPKVKVKPAGGKDRPKTKSK